ncbi:MAG: hypothetical protein GDA52_02165 [Rhodobacteraceae bacterium]|nr:hypothetical protein [Paracoccaceae bacterium]
MPRPRPTRCRRFWPKPAGHCHLKAAAADPDGPRTRLARSFLTRQLPGIAGHLAEATAGADDLYALGDEDLAA